MGKSIGCWLKIFQNIIILTALGQLRYFQGHLCHEFLGHLTTRLRKDETFKRSFGLSLVFFERILTVLTVYQFTSTPSPLVPIGLSLFVAVPCRGVRLVSIHCSHEFLILKYFLTIY